MCLLVKNPADTVFSDEFLTSVYTRNSDGLGVFWAQDGVLQYEKKLCNNAAEFIEFVRNNIQGKNCAWHARLKTHGDIDLINCHPYPVLGFDDEAVDRPMLLAHNGILSTGNAKDVTKSDTWHFINDYLKPILTHAPKLAFEPAFIEMLGKMIGQGNKFILMDHEGNEAIINRSAFIEYQGALLSNTYAWDYYGLHPNAPKQNFQGWQGGDHWKGGVYHPKKQKATTTTKRGGKTSSTRTQGDLLNDSTFDDAWEFLAEARKHDKNAVQGIYTPRIGQMFLNFGHHDMWDLLDWWQYNYVTTDDFKACLAGTKNVKEVLANAELTYDKQLPVVLS